MIDRLKVGDAEPYTEVFPGGREVSGVRTIISIVKKPTDEREIRRFIRGVADKLTENQGYVDGEDLLDDPDYKGRADPNAVYVVEE